MKYEKFLKKHPECQGYNTLIWYSFFKGSITDMVLHNMLTVDTLFSDDDITIRVVAVDHDSRTLYVVKGNV